MNLTLDDLKHTECVMNWDIDAIRKQARISRLVEKFKEKLEEKDVGQTWEALPILLFLSYENFVSKNSVFDSSYLRYGEDVIQYELFVRKHYKAAQHVLHSSWAQIFFKMGNLKSSLNCMSKVTPYKELSNEDKAFVLALKASVFMMYGPPGKHI